ncbi:MAG: outer membrane protein transport protein [Lamprobacter sp.]|nr:outer membrane protein transport protein [Lamprobacter sp.]
MVSRFGSCPYLAMLIMSGNAAASGFSLLERDAAGLGRAYAGQAAVVSPAAVAFNPAAIPETTALSGNLAQLWNQVNPEDAGTQATVPSLYGTHRNIGLGVYGAFGLATDYPEDWEGRYQALYSGINAARVQLTSSWSVTDSLRLGAGVFLQYFEAELTNAVPTPFGDGRFKVEGDDTGFGWSLGALWSPSEQLDLGLSFASKVDHRLSGTATSPLGKQDASVPLTTPEVIRAGLRWRARPALSLLAGASWTRWSRLQSLDIQLGNGLMLSEQHRWRDTWRLDLGGEYERGPWTFRLGTAWDQAPIRDDSYRTPRLPDSDRTWLAAGLSYATGPWIFSTSYAHLWFANSQGEHPPVNYSARSNILALGLERTW